jgi:hypothetical protein
MTSRGADAQDALSLDIRQDTDRSDYGVNGGFGRMDDRVAVAAEMKRQLPVEGGSSSSGWVGYGHCVDLRGEQAGAADDASGEEQLAFERQRAERRCVVPTLTGTHRAPANGGQGVGVFLTREDLRIGQ